MPDREKYIEVLSKTAKTVKEFNEDAPIKISLECIEDILELLKEQDYRGWLMDMFHKYGRDDLIALLVLHGEENLLADVLKEQEVVVRCKECRNWTKEEDYCLELGWCRVHERRFIEEWFCADGERKDD